MGATAVEVGCDPAPLNHWIVVLVLMVPSACVVVVVHLIPTTSFGSDGPPVQLLALPVPEQMLLSAYPVGSTPLRGLFPIYEYGLIDWLFAGLEMIGSTLRNLPSR